MTTLSLDITIPEEHDSTRLDQALSALLPDYSRTLITQWIKDGGVHVNHESTTKQRHKVHTDDKIHIEAVLESAETWIAQEYGKPLPIIAEDDHFLVINKPAGLVVHPGAGNRDHTLINYLLAEYPQLNDVTRCGLIHRIDKDTTGLMVVAKTPLGHQHLTQQLQAHDMHRTYLAICKGHFVTGGTIEAPIGRHSRSRTQMAVTPSGRHAVTHYTIKDEYRGHSLVEITLETGRTHQIRVHFTSIHHPLACDPVYGKQQAMPKALSESLKSALQAFPRQALHAKQLEFAHPVTGETLRFQAPIPQDMKDLMQALEDDYNEVVFGETF